MIRIGITGIIGSGKTTASATLKKRGIPVIDLDQLAREVLMRKDVQDEIARELGSDCVSGGCVNVERVRDVVFTDREKLKKLEAITHPRVLEELWRGIGDYERDGKRAVIVDGPLLFETGLYKELDRTVVVSADMEIVRQRLKTRGMTPDDAENRISNQIPLEEKEKTADYVVRNSGTREDLDREIDKLMERINEWEVTIRCTSTT